MGIKNICHITPQNLIFILTDKLAKQSISIVSFSERLPTGIRCEKLVSNGSVEIWYDNAMLTYEIRDSICQATYLFFNDDRLIDECTKYCDANYARDADGTWLVASPNTSCRLSYCSSPNGNKEFERYFCCNVVH